MGPRMGRVAHGGQYLVARERSRGVDGRDGQVVARVDLCVLLFLSLSFPALHFFTVCVLVLTCHCVNLCSAGRTPVGRWTLIPRQSAVQRRWSLAPSCGVAGGAAMILKAADPHPKS